MRVRDPARERPATAATDWSRSCATTWPHEIGPIAKPRQIMVVPELPKTRSGKIMRRLLRDVAENREVGDVTTLADSSVMDLITDEPAGSDRRRRGGPSGTPAGGAVRGAGRVGVADGSPVPDQAVALPKEEPPWPRSASPSRRPTTAPAPEQGRALHRHARRRRDAATSRRWSATRSSWPRPSSKISVKAGASASALFAGAASSCCSAISCSRFALAYFITWPAAPGAGRFLIVFVLLRADRRAARRSSGCGRSSRSKRPGARRSTRRQETQAASSSEADPTAPCGAPCPRADRRRLPGPWPHRYVCSRTGPAFHLVRGGLTATGRPAAGPAAARLPGVLVGLARASCRCSPTPGYRGGRHGPARLRRQRQDPARLRPAHAGRRTSPAWSGRSAAATRSWSGTAGAGTSAGRPPRCTRARSPRCVPSSAPHPLPMLRGAAGPRPRRATPCATCWPCRCRGCPSAGCRPGGDVPRPSTCGPGAAPGPPFPGRGDRWRRTSGGRPVARAALRAGVPPLAGPVAAARRRAALRPADAAAGHRSRCCCCTARDDPAVPAGAAHGSGAVRRRRRYEWRDRRRRALPARGGARGRSPAAAGLARPV